MALGESCWIRKKGIPRWFHKKAYLLSVKPPSNTLLRYSPIAIVVMYYLLLTRESFEIILTNSFLCSQGLRI
jgi:hypothetical protein